MLIFKDIYAGMWFFPSLVGWWENWNAYEGIKTFNWVPSHKHTRFKLKQILLSPSSNTHKNTYTDKLYLTVDGLNSI
jgi:hypothetical protein